MNNTYTLITFHFGDLKWINLWLQFVLASSDERVQKILIVDQNRKANLDFSTVDDRISTVKFPKDLEQIQLMGHDHAASINRSINETVFETSHIAIFDSDCFPINSEWLDLVENQNLPVLASDPSKWGLTHPCFMVFSVSDASKLDFAQGFKELGIDTGRLVGLQFVEKGITPTIVRSTKGFRGKRGDIYLNNSIYHHGSSSFASASDKRLVNLVNPAEENFFYSKISNGEFRLSIWDNFLLFAFRTTWKCNTQIIRVLSKLRKEMK